MLMVPLPIAVSAAIALLFLRLATDGRDWVRSKQLYAALMAVCALHGLLIGLRWGYGMDSLRAVLPVTATLIPPVTWLAFRSLAQRRLPGPAWLAACVLPSVAVAVLGPLWRDPIDLIVVLQFLVFGVLLLQLGRGGPDDLARTRLSWAGPAHRAVQWAGAILILNGLADIAVFADYVIADGRHVTLLLGVTSIVVLLSLALLSIVGTNASDDSDDAGPPEPETTAATAVATRPDPAREKDVLDRTEAVLKDRRMFLDPDLTLSRLARRAGIPARDISGAINRTHGVNVSQFVNRFRIAEACRLMTETEDSISNIFLDAGFQTKSNFNREFKRHMGVSPSEWRNARQADKAEST